MLDSLLTLSEDAFIYGEFLQGLEQQGHLSAALKRKICAVFSDTCTYLPILKYPSNASWSASIFGPQTVVMHKEDDSLFSRVIPLHDVLDHLSNKSWPLKYRLDDLSDPILFKELQKVISKLRPMEIAWLATHRTLKHTQRCTLLDFELWRFHMNRIFERLPSLIRESQREETVKDPFLEKEIGQAAKDIKQVLLKLENRNRLRRRLQNKLMIFAETYPVAGSIAKSIEKPRTINPLIILKNEARRNLTSILRLYLSTLGLVSDWRLRKKPIQLYIHQLETRFDLLPIRGKCLIKDLLDASGKNDAEGVVESVSRIFKALSEAEGLEAWTNKDNTLDRWLNDDHEGGHSG